MRWKNSFVKQRGPEYGQRPWAQLDGWSVPSRAPTSVFFSTPYAPQLSSDTLVVTRERVYQLKEGEPRNLGVKGLEAHATGRAKSAVIKETPVENIRLPDATLRIDIRALLKTTLRNPAGRTDHDPALLFTTETHPQLWNSHLTVKLVNYAFVIFNIIWDAQGNTGDRLCRTVTAHMFDQGGCSLNFMCSLCRPSNFVKKKKQKKTLVCDHNKFLQDLLLIAEICQKHDCYLLTYQCRLRIILMPE